MKKWKDNWPFFGAVSLLTIGNGDWVITPLVMWLIDSFWVQFYILAILLNIELIGWFRFWRWFFVSFMPERKKVRKTIDFTKEIREKITKELKQEKELKQGGIFSTIVNFFEDQFEWAIHPDRWLIKAMKAGGHSLMLFLGAEPFVMGGRLTGTIFCATTGFNRGLYSLMVGNCIHIMISVGLWNLIFYLLNEYKGWFIAIIIMTILFMVWRYLWKRPKKEEETS